MLDLVAPEHASEFSRSAASKLRNIFAPTHMKQYYPHHPAKGYSLDLIFSNLALDLTEAIDPLIKCDEHHIPVVCTFEANKFETVNFDRIVYNFKKANVEGILNALKNVDWNAAFDVNDVDDNVSKFYRVLDDTIKDNVPLVRIKASHFPPWYDSSLKDCIFEKKKAHLKWKESWDMADRIAFNRLRAKCIRLSRSSYREYTARMETSITANSKVFWSYVNGLKKPGELPSEMYFKDRRARNNLEIAGLFSERFSEVFAPAHNSNLVFDPVIAQDGFCDFQFTHIEVFNYEPGQFLLLWS